MALIPTKELFPAEDAERKNRLKKKKLLPGKREPYEDCLEKARYRRQETWPPKKKRRNKRSEAD